MTFLALPSAAGAYCTLGDDGNYYTDEDPFVNAAEHDFRLKPGACGINMGAVIPGVTDQPDAAGQQRDSQPDIGAFEYIAAGPKKPEGLEIKP